MSAAKRAEHQLRATTALAPQACFELLQAATIEAKPGANYAGQGLALQLLGDPSVGGIVTMTTPREKVCDFAARLEQTDSGTQVTVGGLNEYRVLKHTVFFVPVGTEIVGFGFYKRFLREVETRIKTNDPRAHVTIGEAT